MENLTKQQIVLVTLLVSFMTSIATGIVTVSLMDQAPQGVTQTVNRVVERTIEKITPVPTGEKTQTTIKETIVVKADDQIVGAVEGNSRSMVRLYRVGTEGNIFSGLGIWVSNDGMLLTTAGIYLETGEKLIAKSADGETYDLTLKGKDNGVSVYTVTVDALATSSVPVKVTSAKLSGQEVKLGQSVVSLSGEKSDYVLSGIVSGFVEKKLTLSADEKSNENVASSTASSEPTELVVRYVQTDLSSENMISSTLLLNLSGEVIGLNLRTEGVFVPSQLLRTVLSKVK